MKLADGLEAAAAAHFCKLFDVLMTDPTPQGFKRFEAGLARLADVVRQVQDMIETDKP